MRTREANEDKREYHRGGSYYRLVEQRGYFRSRRPQDEEMGRGVESRERIKAVAREEKKQIG